MRQLCVFLISVFLLRLLQFCNTQPATTHSKEVPPDTLITWVNLPDREIPNLLPPEVEAISKEQITEVKRVIDSLESIYHFMQDSNYTCCYQRAFTIHEVLSKKGFQPYLIFNYPSGGSSRLYPQLPHYDDWFLSFPGWFVHVAPILKLRDEHGGIEELVFDIHLGEFPQTKQAWLNLQNAPESSVSIATGIYYCNPQDLINGCRKSKDSLYADYKECMSTSTVMNGKKVLVGEWTSKTDKYTRLTIGMDGDIEIYQKGVLALQGLLSYHQDERKVWCKTTQYNQQIASDWSLNSGSIIITFEMGTTLIYPDGRKVKQVTFKSSGSDYPISMRQIFKPTKI